MRNRREVGAPKSFAELPEETRILLASLEPEDTRRFIRWLGLVRWAEQTGRIGAGILIAILTVLGAYVTFQTAINMWRGRN